LLLHTAIQIDEGTPTGGIKRGLNPDSSPVFADLQIAGYYLTTMAWLASGAAYCPDHVHIANFRAGCMADSMAKTIARWDDSVTRLWQSSRRQDRHNEVVCSFDLAMAARGLAATLQRGDPYERRRALAALCARLGRISSGAELLKSHEYAPGRASMPDHWSTRAGPHHLKAAAAILRLPGQVAGNALISVARETCEYWMHALRAEDWPCNELHVLLYGFEGILNLAGKRDGKGIGLIERPFARLMEEAQAPDGTLPETVHGGIVRSDVLAQALRIGLLLRGRGFLSESVWKERLDCLADALLGHVRPDGGVLYSHDYAIADTRCALFALQAMYLSARQSAREPAPTVAFQLV
jgi:hypothetical protein